ncbi:protein SMAX1-LIKE 3-like [Mangifera indica]|uniref:protein SMAX1-LIKE 3-like n=1 Tax=Mangifera indica TaxID=29780 RepID=UPI001CFB0288|nr:protein SMAX1-LIKE 3-like [Mangifera indica]
MRAGGCTVQQSLTAEAASVVKQAVTLARRRGHAQVTPLHVANTMLSASTGLLRTACLQSHSHPLQCKALELCFNVALNRLPASTSTPMLGAQSQSPTISNALVAAFKRAQAHQRRGSIENQQQPLLAVKIELEQLIISILDDPSVSRVMREAGFSSTQVKSNVEQAVSLEICSQNSPVSSNNKCKESNLLVLSHQSAPPVGQIGTKVITKPKVIDPITNEDVMYVIENLMNKRRRNFVIVGECLASVEGVVRGVMEKIDKGDVPEALRDVKFIPLSLSSFRHQNREEVEQKVEEIKSLVRSYIGRGVVFNLGDLEWADYRASSSEPGRGYYSSVEHIIMEIGKLASGIGKNERFWLLGIATFQTYMRCKSGHPSLETVWGLHPLTVPAGSLRLSLITDSDVLSQSLSKRDESGDLEKQLTCCADCSAKFEVEARSLERRNGNRESATSTLPAWLRQYKNENKTLSNNNNDKDTSAVRGLCEKWNSICNSIHKQPYFSERTTLTFSSVSPSSSTSGFSYDHHQYPNFHRTSHFWNTSVVEHEESWAERNLWFSETLNKSTPEPSFRMYFPEHHQNSKQPLSSNPNSTPNSACSSDVMEMEYAHNFKELNAENVTFLCNALEKAAPRQKDIIPEIVTTVLKCRSGMLRRKGNVGDQSEIKEETWLFFQGVDMKAKEMIAKELAMLVFGSHSNFVSIALSSFSSTRADSTEDNRKKRSRDERSCSYIERLAEAVSNNPHRVFFIEDVEQADYCSQKGFKRAIERGIIANSNGDEVGLSDAIIILSCESFSSRSRASSPPVKQISNGSDEEKGTTLEETSLSVSLDLNICIDDDSPEDQSIDEIGLLESVDKRIIFKLLEL